MRFHTKKYDIRRIADDGEFNEGIAYEISLNDGYCFYGGSHLEYAESIEELREIIADIEFEIIE